MKVLIIEDDKFISSVYESELHQQNIEVGIAFDGIDGLEKAKTIKPDLILLDLILPKLNGFEVLKELKNDPETKNIPVIVNSVLSQPSDIKEITDLGAAKYLTKDNNSLQQVIKEITNLLTFIKL